MKIELRVPSGELSGIDSTLEELAVLATSNCTSPFFITLARDLTENEPNRGEKMRALVDELRRQYVYASNPLEETFRRIPLPPGSLVDVDDACLFVATLARAAGIPCRFVGARYGKHSWTCFVAYQNEDGDWLCVDPLRQKTDREPEEIVMLDHVEDHK